MAKCSLQTASQGQARASDFCFLFLFLADSAVGSFQASPVFAVDGFCRVYLRPSYYHVFYMIRHNTMVRFNDLAGPCEKKQGSNYIIIFLLTDGTSLFLRLVDRGRCCMQRQWW